MGSHTVYPRQHTASVCGGINLSVSVSGTAARATSPGACTGICQFGVGDGFGKDDGPSRRPHRERSRRPSRPPRCGGMHGGRPVRREPARRCEFDLSIADGVGVARATSTGRASGACTGICQYGGDDGPLATTSRTTTMSEPAGPWEPAAHRRRPRCPHVKLSAATILAAPRVRGGLGRTSVTWGAAPFPRRRVRRAQCVHVDQRDRGEGDLPGGLHWDVPVRRGRWSIGDHIANDHDVRAGRCVGADSVVCAAHRRRPRRPHVKLSAATILAAVRVRGGLGRTSVTWGVAPFPRGGTRACACVRDLSVHVVQRGRGEGDLPWGLHRDLPGRHGR